MVPNNGYSLHCHPVTKMKPVQYIHSRYLKKNIIKNKIPKVKKFQWSFNQNVLQDSQKAFTTNRNFLAQYPKNIGNLNTSQNVGWRKNVFLALNRILITPPKKDPPVVGRRIPKSEKFQKKSAKMFFWICRMQISSENKTLNATTKFFWTDRKHLVPNKIFSRNVQKMLETWIFSNCRLTQKCSSGHV